MHVVRRSLVGALVAVSVPLCCMPLRCIAQSTSTTPPAAASSFITLHYPEDKQYAIAFVDGLPITLEQLVHHIDERHYPGFQQLMAGADGKGSPEGNRFLTSDLIAPWVREFADIKALEAEAKARGDIDQKKLDEKLSAALKQAFEHYLADYVDGLRQAGHPTELTQKRMNALLTDYQLRHGLACEMQGWLDYLEPVGDWTNQQLNDFYQDHATLFAAGVTMEHILIQNRDPGTCILLQEEGRIRAATRLAEVQHQLRPDGSNFEDLARKYSDDTRTGKDGGRLTNVERFDNRLPAALCRTAWRLKDGEVSGVVETQYGWHLVRRIEHKQRAYLLFTEAMLPTVRDVKQRELQENLLFKAREGHKIELKL